MSDEAIPEDIVKVAKFVAGEIVCPDLPCESEIEIIARAIQAERERWQARIAELEQQIKDMDRLDRSVW